MRLSKKQFEYYLKNVCTIAQKPKCLNCKSDSADLYEDNYFVHLYGELFCKECLYDLVKNEKNLITELKNVKME